MDRGNHGAISPDLLRARMEKEERLAAISTPPVQTFILGNTQVAKVLDTLEPASPRVLYVEKRKEDFDPYLAWLQPH